MSGVWTYVRVAFGGTGDFVLAGLDWVVRGYGGGVVVVFSSSRHCV